MLEMFDPKDGTLRISRLVMLDAAVLSLVGWLIVSHLLPAYLTMLVTSPALLIANFAVFWKAYQRRRVPRVTGRLSKLMWLPAVVFTIASVAEIASWIQSPDIRSTIQAIVGLALAGWSWFLVVYHMNAKREDEPQR